MAAEASAAEVTAAEASAEVDAAVPMAAEAGPSAAAEALAEAVHAVVEASAEEATAVVDGAWAEDVPSADADNESNINSAKNSPALKNFFECRGNIFCVQSRNILSIWQNRTYFYPEKLLHVKKTQRNLAYHTIFRNFAAIKELETKIKGYVWNRNAGDYRHYPDCAVAVWGQEDSRTDEWSWQGCEKLQGRHEGYRR
jgi:hypothetical protein